MRMGILQQYGRSGGESVEDPAMAMMSLNAPLCPDTDSNQRRLFIGR